MALEEYETQDIVETLGGEEKAETHLAHMVQIIELGKNGPGLFNGAANIHFKRSTKFHGEMIAIMWVISNNELNFYNSNTMYLNTKTLTPYLRDVHRKILMCGYPKRHGICRVFGG